jgi:hypothetical protein
MDDPAVARDVIMMTFERLFLSSRAPHPSVRRRKKKAD